MKALAAFLILTAGAFGAVEGTVTNLTSGKPQAGTVVTLVELGQGMNNIGSVKTDAEGKFRFDATLKAAAPHLIQALHQGVTYNRMLPPGTGGSAVELQVYNAAPTSKDAAVSQDMILLERNDQDLIVNETVIFTNKGTTTLQKPEGNLTMQLPAGARTPIRVRITAPQGMPITREPEPGKEPGTVVVRYPIKPGETQIDFSYSLPSGGATTAFKGRVLHGGGPVRFVAPQGVKLESAELNDLGPEPRTQAHVYELTSTRFDISISGTGQLRRTQESPAGGQSAGPSEEESPGIDIVKPRLFQRLEWVVGLIAAMLALGFTLLYLRGQRA